MSASFIANPFNILGLSSDCSQSDVRKQVGLISKMAAIGEDVVFDTDLFLEPADRSLDMVKRCESRLNNPQERIADVFFWFADSDDALSAARAQDRVYFEKLGAQQGETGKRDFIEEKNAAVGLSIIFEKSQDKKDFEVALATWAPLVRSDAFWDFWEKYYRSIDYLDTGEHILREFRERIVSTLTEMFFDVSRLDDLIDAQIVGSYFEVSSEAAEKAAEQQLLRIKELRMAADKLRSPDELLDESHALKETSRNRINSLLEDAIALYEELAANGQYDAPAVKEEMTSLWEDVLGILAVAHNTAAKHDAVNIDDLEFQRKVIGKLRRSCKDEMLIARLKENAKVVKDELENLKELEQAEPQYSKLSKVLEKISSNPEAGKEHIESCLTEFDSIYQQIKRAGKLRNKALIDAVSAGAFVFNMLAVKISNEAQESFDRKMRLAQGALQNDRSAQLSTVLAALASTKAEVGFALKILNKLKAMEMDPSVRSKVDENVLAARSVSNSLDEMLNRLSAGRTGSSSGGGGCYVATAVYGSYDCPQVWVLRRYRDFDLAQTLRGRAFIHAYYAISPTLVRLFGDKRWFRKTCQKPLDALVERCRSRGYSDEPYRDQTWV